MHAAINAAKADERSKSQAHPSRPCSLRSDRQKQNHERESERRRRVSAGKAVCINRFLRMGKVEDAWSVPIEDPFGNLGCEGSKQQRAQQWKHVVLGWLEEDHAYGNAGKHAAKADIAEDREDDVKDRIVPADIDRPENVQIETIKRAHQ